MDENSSYKNSLINKVHKTKAAYEMALFNYERISIKDPNWEKQIDAFNLAKLNYETAKSRLEGLKKVKLSVAFSMQDNETANAVQYALATPHYLESWGDVVIKKGQYSLMQPTIKPLFKTRQFQDALLAWTGSTSTYYDFLKEYWNVEILKGKSWNQALHDGVFVVDTAEEEVVINEVDIDAAGSELAKIKGSEEDELILFMLSCLYFYASGRSDFSGLKQKAELMNIENLPEIANKLFNCEQVYN